VDTSPEKFQDSSPTDLRYFSFYDLNHIFHPPDPLTFRDRFGGGYGRSCGQDHRHSKSERHKLEVQHCRYRSYIKKLLNKFGGLTTAKFPGQSAQIAVGNRRASQAKDAVDRPRGTQARQTAKV
jgi:hypothetical protein